MHFTTADLTGRRVHENLLTSIFCLITGMRHALPRDLPERDRQCSPLTRGDFGVVKVIGPKPRSGQNFVFDTVMSYSSRYRSLITSRRELCLCARMCVREGGGRFRIPNSTKCKFETGSNSPKRRKREIAHSSFFLLFFLDSDNRSRDVIFETLQHRHDRRLMRTTLTVDKYSSTTRYLFSR